MTSPEAAGKIPCVEQPALRQLDLDGDGILSMEEILSSVGDHAKVQEVVTALKAQGVVGIRYTGCNDTADGDAAADSNGLGEDLIQLIARAAVAQIYEDNGS